MQRDLIVALGGLIVFVWSNSALPHEGQSELIEELIVYGRAQQMLGAADAASEGVVGYDDIRINPLLRVGELAEAVPGLVATQHSGTGKANQYFLRGFNLDHGTDFSAFANGVPINLRTHGHGQGYLDLNFLIPELIATTTYRKGPYSAEVGDFSSAGTVSFDFYDRLDEALLSATIGSHDYYRALAAGTIDVDSGALTGALDFTTYSGPWDLDEDLEQGKFYIAHTGRLGAADSRLALSAYSGEWQSTDQIPKRAVNAGLIGPRGYIDPDLGGETDRYELTGSLDYGAWRALAYVVDYELSLFSNFTYLLDDPVDGDQFEQTDERTVFGVRFDGQQELDSLSKPAAIRWGGDVRFDDIDEVGLYRTVERQQTGAIRRDRVKELSVSAYADVGIVLTEALRASFGLRADHFDWDVGALREANSGKGSETVFSPKLNLAYRLSDRHEIYANWGRGFHSNDVRGATIAIDPATGDPTDPVDSVAQSIGAELGLRHESAESFNATLSVFWLELDSELVFVGDAGTTEPTDGSERVGVELSAFWQPTDWLAANFAYTYTDSKFKTDQGTGREVPGAIGSSAAVGVNTAWGNGAFAGLRVRYLGDAPLVEDGSVRSGDSLLVNARAGFRWNNLEFRLDVFNLLDSADYDISYYFASRLEGEPLGGVEDIHYHPLEPRIVRASVTMFWGEPGTAP